MKKYISLLLLALVTVNIFLSFNICTYANSNTSTSKESENSSENDLKNVSSPSYILLEPSTNTILAQKDADVKLAPASITKIMTLILIYDAIKAGKISLDDTVTVSDYAASMGGSQVFLEAGETQTVETLIKCICIASANDACVAYIL